MSESDDEGSSKHVRGADMGGGFGLAGEEDTGYGLEAYQIYMAGEDESISGIALKLQVGAELMVENAPSSLTFHTHPYTLNP